MTFGYIMGWIIGTLGGRLTDYPVWVLIILAAILGAYRRTYLWIPIATAIATAVSVLILLETWRLLGLKDHWVTATITMFVGNLFWGSVAYWIARLVKQKTIT